MVLRVGHGGIRSVLSGRLVRSGYTVFHEPFNGVELDILAVKNHGGCKVLIVKLKNNESVNLHLVDQVNSYTYKLKPIFKEIECKTEILAYSVEKSQIKTRGVFEDHREYVVRVVASSGEIL